jgi:hypothetical protein
MWKNIMHNILENNSRPVQFHTDNSRAHPDERLVVMRWKEKKNPNGSKKAPHAARCVSIPKLTVEVSPISLQEALTTAFHEMQDNYIRERVEEMLENNTQQMSINITDLEHEAIAAWLKQTAAGSGKLSKVKIENWFDENLSELLQAAFIQRMNLDETATPEQLKKLEAITSNYKAAISSLASPRAVISPNIAEQMKKAIALAEENDPTARQLRNKLEIFLQPREITLDINL